MEKGALSINSIMKDCNDDGRFNEAINIIETKGFKRIKVPDNIHFIWVGELQLSNISYIKVWDDINKNKSVFLWVDISSSFVNLFQQSLKSYCDDGGKDIFYLRNKAFDYIWPKIKNGETFNDDVDPDPEYAPVIIRNNRLHVGCMFWQPADFSANSDGVIQPSAE